MAVFLVESNIPEITPEFVATIPAHRKVVNQLFADGKLLMYSVSEDRSRWWCSISAKDEFEAMEILGEMPILRFLNPTIHPLMFYNGSEQLLPGIYLN